VRLQDVVLGLRRDGRVNGNVLYRVPQLLRGHAVQRGTVERMPPDTDFLGDRGSGIHVIAGDHDGADARGRSIPHGAHHFLARRVLHAHEPDQPQLPLFLHRHREHAQSVARHAHRLRKHFGMVAMIAERDDFFRSAFHEQPRAVARLHVFELRTERHRFLVDIETFDSFALRVMQESDLGGIPQVRQRRPVAGNGDLYEQLLTLTFGHPNLRHLHLVLGNRSRLVGTNDIHTPQRLPCIEPHDKRVLGRHALHAHRQARGDDRGQSLGNRGHREAHREEYDRDDRFTAERFQKRKAGREGDDHGTDEHAEPLHAVFERRRRRFGLRHQRGDGADLRILADRRDDVLSGSARHECPGEQYVLLITDAGVCLYGIRCLAHRQTLPGQAGFVSFRMREFQDASVRGNTIPCLDDDDIPRHELARRDEHLAAGPAHAGMRGGEFLQTFERLPRTVLLHESQDRVQDEDGEDGGDVDVFLPGTGAFQHAQSDGQEQRGDEDIDEHVLELAQKQHHQTLLLMRKLVPSVFLALQFDGRVIQPFAETPETDQRFIR